MLRATPRARRSYLEAGNREFAELIDPGADPRATSAARPPGRSAGLRLERSARPAADPGALRRGAGLLGRTRADGTGVPPGLQRPVRGAGRRQRHRDRVPRQPPLRRPPLRRHDEADRRAGARRVRRRDRRRGCVPQARRLPGSRHRLPAPHHRRPADGRGARALPWGSKTRTVRTSSPGRATARRSCTRRS